MEGAGSAPKHRHATWLELFFDLVFVVSIWVISHGLSHTQDGAVSPRQLVQFTLKFLPLWWIWASHTLYSNRLDNYSRTQRVMALSIIFLLINLSAMFAGNVLVHTAGFILIYGAIRLIMAYLYFWSQFTGKYYREYARKMCAATLVGALVCCSALLFDNDLRIMIFYAGIVTEMALVALVSVRVQLLPVHRRHLVERIGLMTMILLGESIITLVENLQKFEGQIPNMPAMMAGFVMIGAIWWIYYGTFYLLEGARNIRTGITLMYTHLIFALGLVILANLIGLTMTNNIDMESFRMLAITGLIFFYIGKQVVYFKAFPVYRVTAIVISLISIIVAGLSTYLHSPTLALIGVTLGLLVYVCVNYVWTLSIDSSAYLEIDRNARR